MWIKTITSHSNINVWKLYFAPQASPDKPQAFTPSNKPHFPQVRAKFFTKEGYFKSFIVLKFNSPYNHKKMAQDPGCKNDVRWYIEKKQQTSSNTSCITKYRCITKPSQYTLILKYAFHQHVHFQFNLTEEKLIKMARLVMISALANRHNKQRQNH